MRSPLDEIFKSLSSLKEELNEQNKVNVKQKNLEKVKQFLLERKGFLDEDFKSQEQNYINQGNEPQIVKSYIEKFKIIRDKNYRQLNDQISGLENVRDRKNIDSYKTFKELETIVDYVGGQVDLAGTSLGNDIEIDAKPIYENDIFQIYYADSPKACIKYKGNIPYGWCVSRNDSTNMYYTYRYKPNEPSFYFIKIKDRTKKELGFFSTVGNIFNGEFKDKYHFFVIQVNKGAKIGDTTTKQYYVTSAMNDGDKPMSWDEIIAIEPRIANLQKIFKNFELSPEERKFYDKFKDGIDDETFCNLDYTSKRRYLDIFVNNFKLLTNKQFECLPDDLKNLYVGFGVGLAEEQFELIKSNKNLLKRYQQITERKIEEYLKNKNQQIRFKYTELISLSEEKRKYFIDNIIPLEPRLNGFFFVGPSILHIFDWFYQPEGTLDKIFNILLYYGGENLILKLKEEDLNILLKQSFQPIKFFNFINKYSNNMGDKYIIEYSKSMSELEINYTSTISMFINHSKNSKEVKQIFERNNLYPNYEPNTSLESLQENVKQRNLEKVKQFLLERELLSEKDNRQFIVNKLGMTQEVADFAHSISDKYSIWIANAIKTISGPDGGSGAYKSLKREYEIVIEMFKDDNRPNIDIKNLDWFDALDLNNVYNYIKDWRDSPDVPSVNLRNMTWDEAERLSREWHESLGSGKSVSDILDEKDKIIHKFNNGFYWVLRESNTCEKSRESMGHCATASKSDMYLFRLIKNDEEFITADYDPNDKYIIQLKGKANTKPKEIYYPYIIWLIADSGYIDELRTNKGYSTETNFHLSDLNEKELKYIISKNSNLINILDILNMSEDKIKNIINILGDDLNKPVIKLATENFKDLTTTLILKDNSYGKNLISLLFKFFGKTFINNLNSENLNSLIYYLVDLEGVKFEDEDKVKNKVKSKLIDYILEIGGEELYYKLTTKEFVNKTTANFIYTKSKTKGVNKFILNLLKINGKEMLMNFDENEIDSLFFYTQKTNLIKFIRLLNKFGGEDFLNKIAKNESLFTSLYVYTYKIENKHEIVNDMITIGGKNFLMNLSEKNINTILRLTSNRDELINKILNIGGEDFIKSLSVDNVHEFITASSSYKNENQIKSLFQQYGKYSNTPLNEQNKENIKQKNLEKVKQFLLEKELLLEKDNREIIVKKLGLGQGIADFAHEMSDKYSIWVATSLRDFLESRQISSELYNTLEKRYFITRPDLSNKYQDVISMFKDDNRPKLDIKNLSFEDAVLYFDLYNYIIDWRDSPNTPTLNLRNMSWQEAGRLAEEWHESLEASGKVSYILDDKDEIIHEFNDGFYWVLRKDNRCEKSQESMGHCATASRGDMYLFRLIKDDEEFITADYDSTDEYIIQLKGKKNSKPKEVYYPYIIWLIADSGYIKKLRTNEGYRPETNFHLEDLNKEQLLYVAFKNLDVMNIGKLLSKSSDPDKIINELLNKGGKDFVIKLNYFPINNLLSYSSNPEELIDKLLSIGGKEFLIKLHVNEILIIFSFSSKPDELIDKIVSFGAKRIINNFDSDDIRRLLDNTAEPEKVIDKLINIGGKNFIINNLDFNEFQRVLPKLSEATIDKIINIGGKEYFTNLHTSRIHFVLKYISEPEKLFNVLPENKIKEFMEDYPVEKFARFAKNPEQLKQIFQQYGKLPKDDSNTPMNEIFKSLTSLQEELNEQNKVNIKQRNLEKVKQFLLEREILSEKDNREIIVKKLGLPQEVADFAHKISDKYSLWIAKTLNDNPRANSFIKAYQSGSIDSDNLKFRLSGYRAYEEIISMFKDDNRPPLDIKNLEFGEALNFYHIYVYIKDWRDNPNVPTLNLRNMSWDEAERLSREWHESLQAAGKVSYILDEKDEIIHEFNDGFYWVLRKDSTCPKSEESMGHCATATNENMYLFRLIKNDEEFITIDWNPNDKYIIQIKGKRNSKPKKEYYPYIIWLIGESGYINQLKTTQGYNPETNFHLSDLNDEELKYIISKNINLVYNSLSYMDELSRYKITNLLVDVGGKNFILGLSKQGISFLLDIGMDNNDEINNKLLSIGGKEFILKLTYDAISELLTYSSNPDEVIDSLFKIGGKEFIEKINKNYFDTKLGPFERRLFTELLTYSLNPEKIINALGNNSKDFIDNITFNEITSLFKNSQVPEKIIDILGNKANDYINNPTAFYSNIELLKNSKQTYKLFDKLIDIGGQEFLFKFINRRVYSNLLYNFNSVDKEKFSEKLKKYGWDDYQDEKDNEIRRKFLPPMNEIFNSLTSLQEELNEQNKVNIKEKNLEKVKKFLLEKKLLSEKDNREFIVKKMGLPQEIADWAHEISDKYSLWIANQIKKELDRLNLGRPLTSNEILIFTSRGRTYRRIINMFKDDNRPNIDIENLDLNDAEDYYNIYTYIKDWRDNPNTPTLNLRNMSWEEAERLSREWHESLKAAGRVSYILDEKDEIIHEFNDGFYWVLRKDYYCEKSKDSMGHCATATNSNMYLFRLIKNDEEFITADWQSTYKYIIQIKGKKNSKPKVEYHPYIIWLIADSGYIDELRTDEGYNPETNFHLDDLNSEQLKYVLSNNPILINSQNLDLDNLSLSQEDRNNIINSLFSKNIFKNQGDIKIRRILNFSSENKELLIKQLINNKYFIENQIFAYDNLEQILTSKDSDNIIKFLIKNEKFIIGLVNHNKLYLIFDHNNKLLKDADRVVNFLIKNQNFIKFLSIKRVNGITQYNDVYVLLYYSNNRKNVIDALLSDEEYINNITLEKINTLIYFMEYEEKLKFLEFCLYNKKIATKLFKRERNYNEETDLVKLIKIILSDNSNNYVKIVNYLISSNIIKGFNFENLVNLLLATGDKKKQLMVVNNEIFISRLKISFLNSNKSKNSYGENTYRTENSLRNLFMFDSLDKYIERKLIEELYFYKSGFIEKMLDYAHHGIHILEKQLKTGIISDDEINDIINNLDFNKFEISNIVINFLLKNSFNPKNIIKKALISDERMITFFKEFFEYSGRNLDDFNLEAKNKKEIAEIVKKYISFIKIKKNNQ